MGWPFRNLIFFIVVAALLVLAIVLFTEPLIAFLGGVPTQVYIAHLQQTARYNCDGCFHRIEHCIMNDSEDDFIATAGEATGEDVHFYKNGTMICDFHWSYDMRDGAPYYYEKAGCPQLKDCSIIIR
jgi:hypothetical protein